MVEAQKAPFVWKDSYTKAIAVLIGLVIAVSAVWAIVSSMQSRKEQKAADAFYSVERDYEKIKADFAKAETPTPPTKPGEKAPPVAAKASGNLEQDYGTVIGRFETVIKDHSGTQTSLMAALTLASLQSSYKNQAAAVETLKKVEGSAKGSLLGSLVLNMKASLMADAGDCKGALTVWDDLYKDSSLKFMHDDFNLRRGLCHEALGDVKKAEELYMNISSSDKASVAGRAAQKYLRLLRIKQPQAGTT